MLTACPRLALVAPAKQTPQWALAFRDKRERLGISQEELAFRADVSQALISQIERGLQNPLRVNPARLEKLLLELRWDPTAFTKSTGLELPFSKPRDSALDGEMAQMPYAGSAAAGHAHDPEAYISVPKTHMRPGALAFIVDGHSMDPTLIDGDLVYVDTNLVEPRNNRIYAVHVEGNGVQFRRCIRQGPVLMFVPDNADKGYPILRPEVCAIRIVGEVYGAPMLKEF